MVLAAASTMLAAGGVLIPVAAASATPASVPVTAVTDTVCGYAEDDAGNYAWECYYD